MSLVKLIGEGDKGDYRLELVRPYCRISVLE